MNEAERSLLMALKESIVNSKEVVIELPFDLEYLLELDEEEYFCFKPTQKQPSELELGDKYFATRWASISRTYYVISGKVVVFK